MLAVFDKPETSKEIYFKLSNAIRFNDPPVSNAYKIAGLYAIFKKGICYYVGQSKNIPSRLSTHMTGKYKTADEIQVYFVDDYCDYFYTLSKKEQTIILENNETYLIQALKPIENLLVDNDIEIPIDQLFCVFQENPKDQIYENVTIFINGFYITVVDDAYFAIDDINDRVWDCHNERIASLPNKNKS